AARGSRDRDQDTDERETAHGRGPLAADEHERIADGEPALLRLREPPVRHHAQHAAGQRRPLERGRVDLGVVNVAGGAHLEADDRLARTLIPVAADAQEAGADAREILADHLPDRVVAQRRRRARRVLDLRVERVVVAPLGAPHVAHQPLAPIILDVEDLAVLVRQRRPFLIEFGARGGRGLPLVGLLRATQGRQARPQNRYDNTHAAMISNQPPPPERKGDACWARWTRRRTNIHNPTDSNEITSQPCAPTPRWSA